MYHPAPTALGFLPPINSAHRQGIPTNYEQPYLYRGEGRDGFQDVTRAQRLDLPMLPMGSNFGDLNGNGYLDFCLGIGNPEFESLMPNLMFLNQQGNGFVNVSMAEGFGHLQKGHGVSFADIDNDGDCDVFEQMGVLSTATNSTTPFTRIPVSVTVGSQCGSSVHSRTAMA